MCKGGVGHIAYFTSKLNIDFGIISSHNASLFPVEHENHKYYAFTIHNLIHLSNNVCSVVEHKAVLGLLMQCVDVGVVFFQCICYSLAKSSQPTATRDFLRYTTWLPYHGLQRGLVHKKTYELYAHITGYTPIIGTYMKQHLLCVYLLKVISSLHAVM